MNQKLLRCLVFEQEATAMGGDPVKGQPKLSKKAYKGSKKAAQQPPQSRGADPALQWLCGVSSKEAPSAGETAD